MIITELRKHYTDFTPKEKNILDILVKTKHFETTQYTTYRKQQRKITEDELHRVFDNYKIIELHIKNDDIRVLLRGNTVEQGNINICVVVSLIKDTIITAYYNHKNDLHSNLDESKYTTYINVIGLLSNI